MKTLTIIFAAAVLLTSCGPNNDNLSSDLKSLSSKDSDEICQLIAKNNARKQKLISRGGIHIMELKVDRD